MVEIKDRLYGATVGSVIGLLFVFVMILVSSITESQLYLSIAIGIPMYILTLLKIGVEPSQGVWGGAFISGPLFWIMIGALIGGVMIKKTVKNPIDFAVPIGLSTILTELVLIFSLILAGMGEVSNDYMIESSLVFIGGVIISFGLMFYNTHKIENRLKRTLPFVGLGILSIVFYFLGINVAHLFTLLLLVMGSGFILGNILLFFKDYEGISRRIKVAIVLVIIIVGGMVYYPHDTAPPEESPIEQCCRHGGGDIRHYTTSTGERIPICLFTDDSVCIADDYYSGICTPGMHTIEDIENYVDVHQYFGGGITINNDTLYSGRVFQNPDCDCPPCSVWSTCDNGGQVRTCFKCDASTNNMCRYYMDERVC